MRAFISSTIYDFRDLRSALKLWLEESGYEVLSSEFNDFPQDTQANSYESCIKAIESCDVFILFIGHRIGGWYSKKDNITITRMEYRKAFELFQQGKLRIIPFVRRELWDVREDRKAIERVLCDDEVMDKELSPQDKARILNAPSRFANSAAVIFSFLDEVKQAESMKKALKGSALPPRGNWVYTFTSFRDVIDAMRTCLNLNGNIRRKEATANVLDELQINTRLLLQKIDGKTFPITNWGRRLRAKFSGIWDQDLSAPKEELASFCFLVWNLPVVIGSLKTDRLRSVTVSGVFLEYDRATERLVVGPLQRELLKVLSTIDSLQTLLTTGNLKAAPGELTTLIRSNVLTVPNTLLMHAMNAFDSLLNLQTRISRLHAYLSEDVHELIETPHQAPMPFFESQLNKRDESITDEDVAAFLKAE